MWDTSKVAVQTARAAVWFPALLMALPMAGLLILSFQSNVGEADSVWSHLQNHVLWRVSLNTLFLFLGVSSLSLLLGVFLAWFVVSFDFFGRNVFSWLLAVPLAVPSYVLAFVWVGSLDYSGPFATFLRESFDFDLIAYFPVRSFFGLVVVMSLALFPYIYVLARNAFESLGPSTLEVSRSLGLGPFRSFLRVLIPASMPWILSGLSLVAMETLADFGAVSVFNYDTFTTTIYKTWYGLHSIQGAAQLSVFHIIFVGIFLFVLNRSSKRKSFEVKSTRTYHKRRITPGFISSSLLFLIFSLMIFLTLIFPVYQLLKWSMLSELSFSELGVFSSLKSSLFLAVSAALILCFSVLAMLYSKRILKSSSIELASGVAKIGYAIPGTVIAVAVMLSLTWLFGPLGRYVWLSLIALLLGLCVRFFSVSFFPLDSAFRRIPKSFDEVSRSLGVRGLVFFRKIHIPLLKAPIGSALILVFIDVIKEMPMTVMLRPFGWDTLSVNIYQFTSEGQWHEAAPSALIIVLLAVLPALFFAKNSQGEIS